MDRKETNRKRSRERKRIQREVNQSLAMQLTSEGSAEEDNAGNSQKR